MPETAWHPFRLYRSAYRATCLGSAPPKPDQDHRPRPGIALRGRTVGAVTVKSADGPLLDIARKLGERRRRRPATDIESYNCHSAVWRPRHGYIAYRFTEKDSFSTLYARCPAGKAATPFGFFAALRPCSLPANEGEWQKTAFSRTLNRPEETYPTLHTKAPVFG